MEVIVPTTAASVDDVAAMLMDAIPAARDGVEIRGDSAVFWAPLSHCESVLADTRAAVAGWQANGLEVNATQVTAVPAVPEAEWRDAWKRHFHVARLTRRLVVVPSWETYVPVGDDLPVALDPGLAFGTGAHASTRLVLEELQRLADAGFAPTRVLDVGTGSGILAIAACKLWPAATCTAIDIDALALATCRENAAANGVDDRILVLSTAMGELSRAFSVVVANIQADVLLALRDDLLRSCSPGAIVVLSGLLTPQASGVADEFAKAGQGVTVRGVYASKDDPQWSAVVLAMP